MREDKLSAIRAAQEKVSQHVNEILTKQTEVAIQQAAVSALEPGSDQGETPIDPEEGKPRAEPEL
jgi:hypothetical protein